MVGVSAQLLLRLVCALCLLHAPLTLLCVLLALFHRTSRNLQGATRRLLNFFISLLTPLAGVIMKNVFVIIAFMLWAQNYKTLIGAALIGGIHVGTVCNLFYHLAYDHGLIMDWICKRSFLASRKMLGVLRLGIMVCGMVSSLLQK